MRIAVISDIHGNCVALDAVIDDVSRHPVDRWICLGDAVQGGPQPCEVLERLELLQCAVVLGNADAFLLDEGVGEGESPPQDVLDVRRWTIDRLGTEGLETIKTFVRCYRVELDTAHGLLCFHGSPASFNEILLPETSAHDLASALEGHDAELMCGGHTHLQWITNVGDITFFNPGSVGLVFNRHTDPVRCYPVAEFAIVSLEGDVVRVEFCQVPFDADAYGRAAVAHRHPFAEREGGRFG